MKFKSKISTGVAIFLALALILTGFPADITLAATNEGYSGVTTNDFTRANAIDASGVFGGTFNANMFYPRTDLLIPGRGVPIEIQMAYNSRDRESPSKYGYGWQFSYNIQYELQPNGDIMILWGDGRTDLFNEVYGEYYAPPGINMNLVEYETGKFCLTTKEQIEYFFDSPSHRGITRIEDPNDNALTFSYTNGDLTTITDASGRGLILSYTAGKLTAIADPNTTPNRTLTYAYDAAGNQVGFTDTLGDTTTYGYDSEHLLTSITDPRGNTTTIIYSIPPDDSSIRQIASISTPLSQRLFSYDTEARTTAVTEVLDSETQTTSYRYDEFGRLVEVTDAMGNSQTVNWDFNNNITSITDKNENTYTATYDSKGNLLKLTEPLGNTTTYAYHPTFNKITSITDASDHTFTFSYDANGNLINRTDPLGNSYNLAYDDFGQLTSVTDPKGNTISYTYNSNGDLTQVQNTLDQVMTFGYDNAGNLISLTDANGNGQTFEYDLSNRLTKIIDALGNEISLTYDENGDVTSITDANGNTTTFAYDGLNRVVKVIDALENETDYAYNAVGNLISITDANGNTRTMTYDALKRLTSRTDALGNSTFFEYDPVGNVTRRTDANGNITNFSYDAIACLIKIDYPGTNDISMEYDEVSNMIRLSNEDASLVLTHDELNRATNMTEENLGKSISYTYDELSNVITMTDPDGGVSSYIYDAANRLISLTNPLGQTFGFDYDPAGRKVKVTYPNDTLITASYDAQDRITSVVNKTTDDSIISSFGYTYDAVGNCLSMIDINGDTTSYLYDGLNRLTQVTYPDGSSTTFTYDGVGNRIQMTSDEVSTDFNYDAANRLLTAGPTTFDYDNNGNLIGKTEGADTTTFAYDFENRLTSATFPDGTANSFTYYPHGRRLSKTDTAGITTKFFYDWDNPFMELNSAGATIARYTTGLLLDDWLSMSRGGASCFFHPDALGSTRNLTDPTGAMVAFYDYDPFGNITQQTGSIVNPFRFTAREFDDETGLYYYRARYYDPAVGRFMTKDSSPGMIIQPSSLHSYSYAGNNPVILKDPTGEFFGTLLLVAAGAVVVYKVVKAVIGTKKAGDTMDKNLQRSKTLRKKIKSGVNFDPGDFRRERLRYHRKSAEAAGKVIKDVPNTSITGLTTIPTNAPDAVTTITTEAMGKLNSPPKKKPVPKTEEKPKSEEGVFNMPNSGGANSGGYAGAPLPPQPDKTKIYASLPKLTDKGLASTVTGEPGAVEPKITVAIVNIDIDAGLLAMTEAGVDGSIPPTDIAASPGDRLRISVIDLCSNSSPPAMIQVPAIEVDELGDWFDWESGEPIEGADYVDIVTAGVTQTGADVMFTMELNGSIPYDTVIPGVSELEYFFALCPLPGFEEWPWYSPAYEGLDCVPNAFPILAYRDGSWRFGIDYWKEGEMRTIPLPESNLQVEENTITLRVPAEELGYPPSFSWLAGTYVDGVADIAPNEGAGVFEFIPLAFDEDNPDVATGLASLEDKLVVAYGYKASEGGWTWYNPSWPSGANTLTALYMRRGYWINVSEACNLIYGANTYSLDAGWNLIGWLGYQEHAGDNPDVAEGLASIDDCLEVVYGFDDGVWTWYNPGWPSGANTLTTLYMGRGYWIKVSEDCNLVYGTNTCALDAGWNLIAWLGW